MDELLPITWTSLNVTSCGHESPYYFKFLVKPCGGYTFAVTDTLNMWLCLRSADDVALQTKEHCPNIEMKPKGMSELFSRCLQSQQPGTTLSIELSPHGLKVYIRTVLHVSKAAQFALTWAMEAHAMEGAAASHAIRDHIVQPMCAATHALCAQVDLYRQAILAKDREIQALVDGHSSRRVTPVFVPEKFEAELLASREIHSLLERASLATSSIPILENIQRVFAAPNLPLSPPPHHGGAPSRDSLLLPPQPLTTEGRHSTGSFVETEADRARRARVEHTVSQPQLKRTSEPSSEAEKIRAKKVKKALS